jgi:hypothetical protein
MREIVHLQAGQCGNQIGAKVSDLQYTYMYYTNAFKTLEMIDLSMFCVSFPYLSQFTVFFWLPDGGKTENSCVVREVDGT